MKKKLELSKNKSSFNIYFTNLCKSKKAYKITVIFQTKTIFSTFLAFFRKSFPVLKKAKNNERYYISLKILKKIIFTNFKPSFFRSFHFYFQRITSFFKLMNYDHKIRKHGEFYYYCICQKYFKWSFFNLLRLYAQNEILNIKVTCFLTCFQIKVSTICLVT